MPVSKYSKIHALMELALLGVRSVLLAPRRISRAEAVLSYWASHKAPLA